MDCDYFILVKDRKKSVSDESVNQVISLDFLKAAFILPKNNLSYYVQHGLFEKHLIEWCKQLCSKDKIFLDIGAHTGTYALNLAPYSKMVYAFEPQKSTFYALCGSVALSGLDNIECERFGLGDAAQVGDLELKIRSVDGGGSSVQNISGERILRTETSKIKTLDSYELKDVGFIKMDVEHNELQVLHGAVETIRNNNHPKILFENNNDDRAVFNFILNELGYNKIVQIGGQSNMFVAEM
jgi:FkbM family methyltransferase